MTTTSRGPSRRTLVKGAAWSVPVVVMAGAAPALASSPVIVYNSSASCKVASSKDFRFVFDTELPSGTNVTVSSWTWTPNDGSTAITRFGPVSTPVADSGRLVFVFDGTSSGNGNLVICLAWAGPEVAPGSDCFDTQSNNFNNCSGSPRDYPQRSRGGVEGPFVPPIFAWPQMISGRVAAEEVDVKVDERPESTDAVDSQQDSAEAPAPVDAPAEADGITDNQNG